MSIDNLGGDLLLAFVFLIVVGGLVAAYAWRRNGWGAAGASQVATWALLSLLAMAVLMAVAFVAVHALLFLLGTGAAWVGIIVSAILLVLIPLAIGRAVIRPASR
jgi:hypothetical protein